MQLPYITFIVLVLSQLAVVRGSFDVSVTRPWEWQRTFIEVTENATTYKLAVTYAVPIPPTTTTEVLPVLMEYLPYRKDDSEYPIRYNYFDYFASRGFVYAYVDIRGTGGSEGRRIAYEYSTTEIEDGIQIIQKLGTMRWNLTGGKSVRSNGKVALWGQSWSAFNAFIIAGKKASDPRLAPLQTIVPVHGAVNLYEGDLHYMDGIFHEDEYILSVDHENALPSYGFAGGANVSAYQFDAAYLTNRWTADPWSFFFLRHQAKDAFWTDRTKFFNGPFTSTNRDNFTMPVFVIGSLLDGYRDAPLAIYEKLKAKRVPVKMAMSPSTHTLMDQTYPGPAWEWRAEVARWLYYWLVNQTDRSLITANEFAVFVRSPGDDTDEVPGYWRNQVWPCTTRPTRFYMTHDHRLVAALPRWPVPVNHSLVYKPAVGTQMGVWWGEAGLGDMTPLDTDSLVYDLPFTYNVELVGFTEVALRVAATSTTNLSQLLAHWHVRLEDVAPDGTVMHVTGASVNGAYRNASAAPSLLQSGQYYNVTLRLHFTTWTFLRGHKARIAITNGLYRMMWPSPHPMVTQLAVCHAATYVSLPLSRAERPPRTPHPYSVEPSGGYTEPADGWYFGEGGYPRVYTVADDLVTSRRVVTWKSDYYGNYYGWLVSIELDHEFSQHMVTPSDTTWTTYARQIYQYVGVSNKTLWADVDGYPSILAPGVDVPTPLRSFTLETWLNITSDVTTFYASLQRSMIRSDGPTLNFSVAENFTRFFQ